MRRRHPCRLGSVFVLLFSSIVLGSISILGAGLAASAGPPWSPIDQLTLRTQESFFSNNGNIQIAKELPDAPVLLASDTEGEDSDIADPPAHSALEERLPGAEITSDPKDLRPRTGGMPMEVPLELDQPSEQREAAILQRQTLLNRFNPAIGLVVETIVGYTQRRQRFVDGDGDHAGSQVGTRLPSNVSSALRTIELFASAEVDPFARAYLIASGHAEGINARGSEEFGKAFFEIEEAAIQSTSLPYNLSVRGGRFFSDWGFLGRRHAHDLPQIDVPPSLAQIFGNGNRTDGIELTWLVPVPFYLQINTGYGFNFGLPGEGPLAGLQRQVVHGSVVFGSIRTYFDLNDDHNIEFGFSGLFTPQSRVPGAVDDALLAVSEDDPIDRHTLNVDFHYRWYPLGRGLRQSFALHGEILYDFGQGRRDVFGNTVSRGAWGGYTYLEYRYSKRWRPGFRFDYHQLPSEPALVTNPLTGLAGTTVNTSGKRTEAMTLSPYITFYPSEFQRFVLQFNHSNYGNTLGPNNQVLFQWQVVIGSHQHGFTERE
ncbi:MAG: hypothetical protein NPIRA04_31230 [Nitrospirales bacterium]|nr:MAG: hypothetical protein NPIRA04_31230 [Nitrospirales bacterium]